MLWEDVRAYVSANFKVVSNQERNIVAWVRIDDGPDLAFLFSYLEYNGFRWLTLSARIGSIGQNAYQRLVGSKDLSPNGGFDVLNGEVWLRNVYPISDVMKDSPSGAVYGNELSHCVYALASDAQYILRDVAGR